MGQAKRRKAEIEELKKNTTGMFNRRLYHGTTEAVAQRILSGKGLEPRGQRPSMWQHAPSRSDCVYLTDLYGVKYASDISINTYKVNEKVKGAVVEVKMMELNQRNLLADEDFMAKMTMAANREKEWTLEEFVELEKYYATHDEGANEAYNESLRYYGTVTHRGAIPHSTLTRIALMTLPLLAALRFVNYPDPKLWEIHPNLSPANPTEAQMFQAELTHTVFDTPHPDIQVHLIP